MLTWSRRSLLKVASTGSFAECGITGCRPAKQLVRGVAGRDGEGSRATPVGAPTVRIRFTQDANGTVMSVLDPDVVLTARRSKT
jgi:hypothetical protein